MNKQILYSVIIAGAASLLPIASYADLPGKHPGYLHAMSDLSMARSLIYRPAEPNVTAEETNAIREIDECYKDVAHAAMNDGKNINAQPGNDLGLDFKGRLHKALDALRKARGDMDKEEDDPMNHGLQSRATQHVDRAIEHVKRAIGDEFKDHMKGY